MSQSNYLTVSQVVDQLNSSYQKVLYMIRTNKLPAKKEGRAFKIPVNYQELMGERAHQKKKRAARKGNRVTQMQKTVRTKPVMAVINQEQLVQNLVRAIQELVDYQFREVVVQKKTRIRK